MTLPGATAELPGGLHQEPFFPRGFGEPLVKGHERKILWAIPGGDNGRGKLKRVGRSQGMQVQETGRSRANSLESHNLCKRPKQTFRPPARSIMDLGRQSPVSESSGEG